MYLLVTQTTNITTSGNAEVVAGANHTFTCSPSLPSGGEISSYQWTNPSGAVVSTESSYIINGASINDAGTYTCTVTVTNSSDYTVIVNTMATGMATLTVNGK